jgi:N-acetylglucosaminyl-diphospho-decaprenol L-rhamnosyltransferase
MPTEMDISIIIVSYNCKSYLQRCLQSVRADIQHSGLAVEVIVIDNDSTDGTRDLMKMKKYGWVRWVKTKNNGFGAGNNIGLKKANGQYIFLLNPDTEIEPGALWKLREYLRENPTVGVVGPRLVYGDGSLQISAFDSFPGWWSALTENTLLDRLLFRLFPRTIYYGKQYSRALHDRERQVAHLLGAALFCRREVYEQVGDFDEQFFLFREETDWQRRIRLAGWQMAFFPGVTVTHFEGKSTGDSRHKLAAWCKKLNSYLPSVYKYQAKWYGDWTAGVLVAIFVGGAIWTELLLLLCLVINNTIGWLLGKRRVRINKSIYNIGYYHWAVLQWHLSRWWAGKKLF